ncbi:hypothetical protein CONLIGDRAFT_393388 [Coniochaeta ligniaria NRRL 30616]|uniref:AP-1 complex subunit sigma-1 n=1 Tax=Coniochaeta ligniaria NRRL 30616 TaxID=1408157 RepID=A0A1J7IMX9_9PEZI|nr:hypothetical protein CONLIGDRAFT_393388 [Coniochaeta ligniaria NRRL 30616]
MAINYLILLSRQGKVRLAKWFTTLSPKEKAKIVKDVSQLVLARRTRMCNFLEYKDTKIVYRRYASLFFIAGCSSDDNELITLEIIHRYVEQMDKYYGNVCELDIIFSFTKAYYILDELLLAGELQESSKKNVLRCIAQQDSLEDMEIGWQLISVFPCTGYGRYCEGDNRRGPRLKRRHFVDTTQQKSADRYPGIWLAGGHACVSERREMQETRERARGYIFPSGGSKLPPANETWVQCR